MLLSFRPFCKQATAAASAASMRSVRHFSHHYGGNILRQTTAVISTTSTIDDRWSLLSSSSSSITMFGGTATSTDSSSNSSINSSSKLRRSHYTYAGPGRYGDERHMKKSPIVDDDDTSSSSSTYDSYMYNHHRHQNQSWKDRGFTVGIGGPVGSGKTALVLALIKRLGRQGQLGHGTGGGSTSTTTNSDGNNANDYDYPPLGVVTNDIFTQEDAQFLHRNQNVLDAQYILPVETGGCPHAAIREDVSANLTACEQLTSMLLSQQEQELSSSPPPSPPPIILCESGGDNLAANFSRELADLTLYVIDVAGGDKVPRKGGPGITQSDLLVINKIDLAPAVGADLSVMEQDANMMRRTVYEDTEVFGPTVFASVRQGTAIDDIENFILQEYTIATGHHVVAQEAASSSSSSSSEDDNGALTGAV